MRRPFQPYAILSDSPTIDGVYLDGVRVTNLRGGTLNHGYRSPKNGGPPQQMCDYAFTLRPRSGPEVILTGEVTEAELPYLEQWIPRELGSEAFWDKSRESEVWGLLSLNTANPAEVPQRKTTEWRDGEAIYRLGKALSNFDAVITRETKASNGECFYRLKVTMQGASKYIDVSWDQLGSGTYAGRVGQDARLSHPLFMQMFLTSEWGDRSPEDRRRLQIADFEYEKMLYNAAIDRRIADIRNGSR